MKSRTVHLKEGEALNLVHNGQAVGVVFVAPYDKLKPKDLDLYATCTNKDYGFSYGTNYVLRRLQELQGVQQ